MPYSSIGAISSWVRMINRGFVLITRRSGVTVNVGSGSKVGEGFGVEFSVSSGVSVAAGSRVSTRITAWVCATAVANLESVWVHAGKNNNVYRKAAMNNFLMNPPFNVYNLAMLSVLYQFYSAISSSKL